MNEGESCLFYEGGQMCSLRSMFLIQSIRNHTLRHSAKNECITEMSKRGESTRIHHKIREKRSQTRQTKRSGNSTNEPGAK